MIVNLIAVIIVLLMMLAPLALIAGVVIWFVRRGGKGRLAVPGAPLQPAMAGIPGQPVSPVWPQPIRSSAQQAPAGSFAGQAGQGYAAGSQAAPFAPSELIYLNGEKYAQPGGMLTAKVKLLHAETKVSASELGQAILAATVLAGEQSGGIRLRTAAEKRLFGLRTVNVLYADPGPQPARFPDHSLEAQVCALVAGGPVRISNLFYTILQDDSSEPWQDVTELVKGGLNARGWLEAEEVRHLKVFKSVNYRLPQRTAQLAAAQSLDPINRMLNGTAQQRPELWQLLVSELISARNSRLKQYDSGDSGGSSFD
ncbi:MAG TPA: hypothetical protein VNQ79_00145 [Blastocatellia bacterium]|nr:hypothetical protein [Blastocatellia bacterium]